MTECKTSRLIAVAVVLIGAGISGACAGEYPQSTFDTVTLFGDRLNDLLGLVTWFMLAILAIVIGVLTYIIIRFRDRPGAPPARKVYGNDLAEILWTLAPAVIVAIILVPTVQLIFETYSPHGEGDSLIVDVVGHQWWWEYEYPQLELVTANELHLPIDRPITLRLWTADVLHSWWVPRLGGKRDNFPRPAVINETAPNWHVLRFEIREPGEYSGQCAEFCGLSHAYMRTRVVAQTPEDFRAWVEDMRGPSIPTASAGAAAAEAARVEPEPFEAGIDAVVRTPAAAAEPGAEANGQQADQALETFPVSDSLVLRGYEIFMTSSCIACHTIEGTRARGRIGPDLTRIGSRWALGAGVIENTYENMVDWITYPESIKPGAMMPGIREPASTGFAATGLTVEEVRAVAAYLQSLK